MLGVAVRNPGFRRVWLSQVVGQAGDWMNRMGVLALIGQIGGLDGALVGAGALYGVELAARLLPAAALGPIAGPLADRLPRKALMIATDLLRVGVVLAMLTVDRAEELPRLFVLVVLQMGLAHFFNTARSASVPNTVPLSELHEAHALSSATWSAMLAIGSLVGAALIGPLGIRGVLIADAGTYVLSALLLVRLRLPAVPRHPEPFRWREIFLATELRRGLHHVRALGVGPAVFAKTMWGGAGGFLAMLPVVSAERFGGDRDGAVATGVLYAARGLGTGLGPVLARWRMGSTDAALRRQIGGGFLVGALGYVFFAFTHDFALAIAWVIFAHLGGSALWVASTVAWQQHVHDAYRGRAFALEFFGMTVAFSAGGLGAGWLYDTTGSTTWTVLACCGAILVCGLAWRRWAATGLGRGDVPDPTDSRDSPDGPSRSV